VQSNYNIKKDIKDPYEFLCLKFKTKMENNSTKSIGFSEFYKSNTEFISCKLPKPFSQVESDNNYHTVVNVPSYRDVPVKNNFVPVAREVSNVNFAPVVREVSNITVNNNINTNNININNFNIKQPFNASQYNQNQVNQSTKPVFRIDNNLIKTKRPNDTDLEYLLYTKEPNWKNEIQSKIDEGNNQRNNNHIRREDFNEIETLLKKLQPDFEHTLISSSNKYAIEIKHRSKNLRYILEVEKATLNVMTNEKIFNGSSSVLQSTTQLDFMTFINNEIHSYL